MIYSRIAGVGSYLPGTPVSNDDLAARGIETNDEWIATRTGIRARYLAQPDETTAMLSLEAAQRAMAMAGVTADQFDLIVVGTTTPGQLFPSTACLVQNGLGNVGATAFDVQAVCGGFVYALSIADKFIKSGTHKRALVIGAETLSRIIDWQDRTTCVLFGDGAGAVVLEASEQPGILATALHADGSQKEILNVTGCLNAGQIQGDPFIRMDGQSVFKFAVRVLSEVAEEVCAAAGLASSDIDLMVPHQANLRIIESTAKKLGIAMENVIVTVDRHGNTSAASVPLALDHAVRSGRLQRGQKVLLEAVGGGFTWGAVLFEF